MHRVRQATGVALIGVGLFLIDSGRRLGLEGLYGPGPGFLAFWAGVALAIASGIWLGRLARGPGADSSPFVEERGGLARVGSVVLALSIFAVVLRPAGFTLAMLLLLAALFVAYSRERLVLKTALAVAGSFGTHYVLEQLLGVPLPRASLGYLQLPWF